MSLPRRLRACRWIVEMRGSYWRSSHIIVGDWVKDERKATRFSLPVARSYLRDWASYGARVRKVSV